MHGRWMFPLTWLPCNFGGIEHSQTAIGRPHLRWMLPVPCGRPEMTEDCNSSLLGHRHPALIRVVLTKQTSQYEVACISTALSLIRNCTRSATADTRAFKFKSAMVCSVLWRPAASCSFRQTLWNLQQGKH